MGETYYLLRFQSLAIRYTISFTFLVPPWHSPWSKRAKWVHSLCPISQGYISITTITTIMSFQ